MYGFTIKKTAFTLIMGLALSVTTRADTAQCILEELIPPSGNKTYELAVYLQKTNGSSIRLYEILGSDFTTRQKICNFYASSLTKILQSNSMQKGDNARCVIEKVNFIDQKYAVYLNKKSGSSLRLHVVYGENDSDRNFNCNYQVNAINSALNH